MAQELALSSACLQGNEMEREGGGHKRQKNEKEKAVGGKELSL